MTPASLLRIISTAVVLHCLFLAASNGDMEDAYAGTPDKLGNNAEVFSISITPNSVPAGTYPEISGFVRNTSNSRNGKDGKAFFDVMAVITFPNGSQKSLVWHDVSFSAQQKKFYTFVNNYEISQAGTYKVAYFVYNSGRTYRYASLAKSFTVFKPAVTSKPGLPIEKASKSPEAANAGLLQKKDSMQESAKPSSISAASPAYNITGDSNTYLQSRENEDKTKILGAYEYLNFSVQDTGNISFHVGGWLQHDFKGEESDKKSDSDLQYAYLSYKSKSNNAVVNLGRVMVFEGVATERVDGVYARTDLAGNFGVSAFGGQPVDVGLDLPGNNIIYGTRLTHQVPGLYRIGLSFLKEEKNSGDFRKEEGIDLWLRPVNKVELTGNSKYNAVTSDWANHSYYLVLGPFSKVRLNTEASLINYKDYFTGASTSAFIFQPSVIDPNEKARILGEEVAYDVTDKVNLSVNYKAYTYEIAGHANYYGGNLKYHAAPSGGAGLSIHKMDGNTDRLKYSEYRVYGYGKIGKTNITLDIIDVAYAAAINDVKDAYSISLAALYDMTEKLKLGADVEYSKNPDFDKDTRAFIKMIYHFDSTSGKQR
jgi:hypothetical protein